MKIAIIINAQRLSPSLKEKLMSDELKTKYNIDYDLFTPEPKQLDECLNNLNYQTYNACLIGGGDGTVRTAAPILAENHLPLIIMPLGTFNVLATSLAYPENIDDIFNIIKNNKTKEIDLAEVNKISFINHAWLGVYYDILKFRKRYQNFFKKNRLFKALLNMLWMFKKLPIYEFKLNVNNQTIHRKTCLIFISNNESSSDLTHLGQRPLLATGLLVVTILNCYTRWQMFSCMCSFVLPFMKKSRWIEQFSVDQISVASNSREINVILDGEPFSLTSPLQFINKKNVLTVMVV